MLNDLLKNAQKFALDNTPAILTAIGVVGTVSTAVLAGRAAVQATDIIREAEDEAMMLDAPELDIRDKAELTWAVWIPPAASCVLTIGAIIGSNVVSTRRSAALATAYAIAEKAFDEYKDKVKEKMGPKKEQALRDDVNQERLNKNPVSRNDVYATGRGDTLCYDRYTGRYFYSDIEEIRKAVNAINQVVLNNYYASLSDLYDRLGLDRTKFSDEIGWNVDKLLEMEFSTMLADDGRPCLVMDFRTDPIRYYNRVQ